MRSLNKPVAVCGFYTSMNPSPHKGSRSVAVSLAGRYLSRAALLVFALGCGLASAETVSNSGFGFVNVVDNTTQGFTSFGTMPAINNRGEVAFVVTGQGVFKWHTGAFTTIASTGEGILSNFGDDVVINSSGVVAYDANLNNTGDKDIFTSDGVTVKTIVDSEQQGLVGGAFLGIGAMNSSGTVAFTAFRSDFASQGIFAGNGGALTTLLDTINSGFDSLGNVAINASDDFVFRGFRTDGSAGIFAGPGGATVIADTNDLEVLRFSRPGDQQFRHRRHRGFP